MQAGSEVVKRGSEVVMQIGSEATRKREIATQTIHAAVKG